MENQSPQRLTLRGLCLFQFCIQNATGGGEEVLNGFFAPGGFRGIEQLQIILVDDLSGDRVLRGIPMVPVFVHGVLQAQNGIEERVADGAELKAGGVEVCICLLLLCQPVEEVRGVTGGGSSNRRTGTAGLSSARWTTRR